MRAEHVDHYAALGVAPTADAHEIRAAYRQAMRRWHPDVRPGDAHAAERALRANQAWRVLRDPESRAAYDRQLRARAGEPPTAVTGLAHPDQRAHAARRKDFGRAFHAACLKVGVAVFALGVLLLAFTAR